MTREEIERLVLRLMRKHGLLAEGWTFHFNRRTSVLAICKDSKQIELSKYLIGYERKFIRELTLHEIAHALVGVSEGHGPKWVSKCKELGIKPTVVYDRSFREAAQWTAICSSCNTLHSRRYKPTVGYKYYCEQCGNTEILKWTRNASIS